MQLTQLITNKILLSLLFSWLTAATIKFAINNKKNGYSPGLFIATGGMPSSHVAFSTALMIATGLTEGFTSTLCIITFGLEVIIIHDAINLRGKIDRRFEQVAKKIKLSKFDDTGSIGHHLPEVIAGIIIGILVPLIIFTFF